MIGETERSRDLESRLAAYKASADGVLFSYLPDREPRRHLYDLVRSYPKRAGKGLRPALCIATAMAFGSTPDSAARSAAAIEMFHNGFLIHDDVEDESEYRRGLLTLHEEHGLPIAVNAGDALFVLAIRPLMDNLSVLGPTLTWLIFSEIEHMVHQSVEGQAIELGWVRENECDLVPADYLRMCLKKTCWYTTIHPCRIGALIGTQGTVSPSFLDSFGYYMGIAFQIQDDLLNLIGEYGRYGKEIGGDVLEGKRTLVLIHLLTKLNQREKKWMREFLATPRRERSQSDVKRVYSLMEKYGSMEFGRSSARFLAGAALSEFDRIYGALPDSPDKAFVRDITLYMIERDV